MDIYQALFSKNKWDKKLEGDKNSDLVLLFGDIHNLYLSERQNELIQLYPNAEIVGCSTAGEIHHDKVSNESLSLTSISFNSSNVKAISREINKFNVSSETESMIEYLKSEDLKNILILSFGYDIGVEKLINDANKFAGKEVLITGGIAGSIHDIDKTLVCHNEKISNNLVVFVGFYGDNVQVSSGCEGGWLEFGPERDITKFEDNKLYSLDNKPILNIYRNYLGDEYDKISPFSLFPIVLKDSKILSTRGILDANNQEGYVSVAGTIPDNCKAQFMMASQNDLIDGAEKAAIDSYSQIDMSNNSKGIVLMVSCIGRKMLLKHFVEDEVAVVKETFGSNWSYAGFYSFGELSPREQGGNCILNNQTMTILAIGENNE